MASDWGERGGVIVCDADGEGGVDVILSQPGRIVAHSQNGDRLWRAAVDLQLSGPSENDGLPGRNGSSLQCADVDGDGTTEVIGVTTTNTLAVVDGRSGKVDMLTLPSVDSATDRWEQVRVAGLQTDRDTDIVLQSSEQVAPGYLRGSIVAAFTFAEVRDRQGQARPLWRTNDFVALSHGALAVADLDGNGRDEIIGGTILGPDGSVRRQSGVPDAQQPHVDSIAVCDFGSREGLQVVVPEEGGAQRVIAYDMRGTAFSSTAGGGGSDGDKVQCGDFDPSRPGIEVFLRHNESDRPWVLDETGTVIAEYTLDDRTPDGWTDAGIEMIWDIQWTGDQKTHCAATERHTQGRVGVFDCMTGRFVEVFDEQADRLLVVDARDDWREELVAVSGSTVTIYGNPDGNPRPDRPRLAEDPNYVKDRMNWNYYTS